MMMNKFIKILDNKGLKASPTKCRVLFGGVDTTTQELVIKEIGFKTGTMHFRYLGVPLINKKLTVAMCSPLIDKVLQRIHH